MIPIFKTHFSLGKSILAVEPLSKSNEKNSLSHIIDRCGLKSIVLIEDSFSSFWPAYFMCKEKKAKLVFGISFNMYVGSLKKDTPTHKANIVCKNTDGYKQLIKIYNESFKKSKSKGVTRLSYSLLEEMWSSDLIMTIPFYDSFIYNNILTFDSCVPDLGFTKPIVFLENNDLPFDHLLHDAATLFANKNGLNTENVKTIYYSDRDDFDAWLTFKCINKRSFGKKPSIERPNLDHCSSREFCIQSYLEHVKI